MQYRNVPWEKYDVEKLLQHPSGTLLLCISGRVRLPYLCELSGNFPDDREVMVLNRSLRKYENLSRKRNVEYYVLPQK